MAVPGLWLDPPPLSSQQLLAQDLLDQSLESLASWPSKKSARNFTMKAGPRYLIQLAGWDLMHTRTTNGLGMMIRIWLLSRQGTF